MRSRTVTFIDLLSRYQFLLNGEFWVVGRRESYENNDEVYDIYFVTGDRYEYLASDRRATNNQVVKIIFERLGL